MKSFGVLCALLFSLGMYGSQAQAQPAAQNYAPSMPPAEIRAKKLLCHQNQYLKPGHYEWDGALEKWKWWGQKCTPKPSYWHEGCTWQKGYWESAGQGARFHYGAVSCPPKKKVTPPPVVAPKRKVEKKVSPPVATPKAVEKKEMPILAVFDIEVVDLKVKRSLRNSLADFVAMRMTETRAYEVLPRSQLKTRLIQSKKASFKDCYDQACQIEVGKELAAEKTLATKISKMGRRCMISLGVYDLRKATAEKAATHMGKCTEDALIDSMEKAIKKLTGSS